MIARLANKWIPEFMHNPDITSIPVKMQAARKTMTSAINRMVNELADDFMGNTVGWDINGSEPGVFLREGTISLYFLSTLVGFYACDEYVVIFSIGDGFYAINGEVTCLDSNDNTPEYLSYNLIPRLLGSVNHHLEFNLHVLPADDVKTIMVGTDGVRFLIDKNEDNIPGKLRKIGGIEQLWDDKMFTNSDMMRRTLSLLNKDVHLTDWQGQSMIVCPSILKDDTTVISARRTK